MKTCSVYGILLGLVLITVACYSVADTSMNVTKLVIWPGSNARLSCKINKNSKIKYSWWKDGERIETNKRLRYNKKGIFIIKKVTAIDTGMYTCKDLQGRNLTEVYLVLKEIHGEPVFKKGMKNLASTPRVVLVREKLRLDCKAEGTPPITYSWKKDGKPIFVTKQKTEAYMLKIDNIGSSDAGNYTCNASNQFGYKSYTFHVMVYETVRSKPHLLPDYPKKTVAHIGENASMDCFELFSRTKLAAMVDFRWYLWEIKPDKSNLSQLTKNAKISQYTPGTIQIRSSFYETIKKTRDRDQYDGVRMNRYNVSMADDGYYSCVACNNLGCAVRTARLTIIQETEALSIVVPTESNKPITTARQRRKMEILPVIGTAAAVFLLLVLIVTLYFVRRFMKKKNKRTRSSAEEKEDSEIDDNLNKKNSIVKYNGHTRQVSCNSSTAPLLHSGSSRSTTDRSLSDNGRFKGQPIFLSQDSEVNMESLNVPLDEVWEINRDDLILAETLGEGAFGIVIKAKAISLPGKPRCVCTVAVKMLKANATENEFFDLISEMETMKRIGKHRNIINFLGCCTQNGSLYVVVEYAPYGNLRQHLRSKRPPPCVSSDEKPEASITLSQLVSFALQISKGMEFLAAHQCIHRDLAARNILVGEHHLMKIADFGLARNVREADYYRKTTDGRLPVKWLSIEALFDRVYTTQSDVWAYGVLLWEIFTLGGSPYPSIPVEKLFALLKSGYRMQRPQGCPSEIYEIMVECWFEDANARPNFTNLVQRFEISLESLTSSEYMEVLAGSMTALHEVEETADSGGGAAVSSESSKESSSEEQNLPLVEDSNV